ncbi:hypothetical protein B0H14DRAFT_699581 [Mycena olivaceomarginata]|nr:hypothetical protein B0H14DRAFT_699581 [Mycena olivaceomarginata]
MNRSVNVQRSASSQSPVTPPRRIARPPLSPKNNQDLRRHHIPPRDMSDAQSLAYANSHLIHERLQQNHNRLQVQLHARPPAAESVGPVKAFLDTTFRTYASRIQTEFTSLRAACARAVQREQHQTAQIRSTCARLARERDVAEEKLRVLLDRRAAAAATKKRTRAEVEKEDEAAEAETMGLLYPLSPVSPPQMPTQSPPPRLLSPFVLAARRSPSRTPNPEDTTGFDLTIRADSLPRPSKKRRTSASPEPASETASGEATVIATKERQTCPPAGFGECDMELESESESDDTSSDSEADSASTSATSHSQHSSRAASGSPPAEVPSTSSLQKRPIPASPAKAHLPLEYVDIMYLPTDDKLVCRVCLLAASGSGSGRPTSGARGPIKAFLPGASWDMLRRHCEETHADACRDVVGLGQAGVQELRRRLGLAGPVQPEAPLAPPPTSC